MRTSNNFKKNGLALLLVDYRCLLIYLKKINWVHKTRKDDYIISNIFIWHFNKEI